MKASKSAWKRALGEQVDEELPKVKDLYERLDFLDCIDYIKAKHSITPNELSENTYQIFFYPHSEFARLIYDPEHKRIVISFCTQTSIVDAILFFQNLKVVWKDIALMVSYYVDVVTNQLYLGTEAEAKMYDDLEDAMVENFMLEVEDPIVDAYLKGKSEEEFVYSSDDKFAALEYFLRLKTPTGYLN